MARRKVTMLEAFQASERATEERAVSEQRRLAAEREKEARRVEASRSASEWKRRIGEGVGSLFGPKAEASEASAAPEHEPDSSVDDAAIDGAALDARSHSTVQQGGDPPGAPVASGGSPAAPGPPGPPAATTAASGRGREPSWSSSGLDATDLVDAGPPPAGSGAASSGAAHPGAEVQAPGPAVMEQPEGEEPEPLSAEQLAAATAPPPEFAVPMTGRTFALVLAVAMGAVFAIGMMLGGTDDAEADGTVGAAERSAASGAGAVRFERPRTAGARDGAAPQLPGSPAEPSGQRGPAGQAAARPADSAASSSLTAADRAFFDESMKFTVLTITYARNETNEALAWEAYDTLAAAGFPVVQPVPVKRRIFIFVGAAEAESELVELRNGLRGLRVGRSGRQEFHDAHIVNTDRYR